MSWTNNKGVKRKAELYDHAANSETLSRLDSEAKPLTPEEREQYKRQAPLRKELDSERKQRESDRQARVAARRARLRETPDE